MYWVGFTSNFLTIFIIFISLRHTISLRPYKPFSCPENITLLNQVCIAPCDNVEAKPSDIHRCVKHAESVSHEAYKFMTKIATDTLEWVDDCKRPEEAFHQSILLPDKTDKQLLLKFDRKLHSCEDRTISIVVFGGSVTVGQSCGNKVGENSVNDPDPTNHLGLPPNLTLPLVLGDGQCPWSNQLATQLKHAYPHCKHIDVYNLAHHATDHSFLLDNVIEYFKREGGARGGKRLGDVVDLVLVDYAVNDGLKYSPALGELNLTDTVANALGRLEAMTEYFIQFILNQPNEPALLYVESGGVFNLMDSLRGHYDAAKRFGVPVVSPRHVASFPDNPCYLFFHSTNDKLRSRYGYFPHYIQNYNHSDKRTRPFLTSNSKIRVREGDHTVDIKGRPRDHKYISCWSFGVHPRHSMHTLIAESIFFFLQVVPAAQTIMKTSMLHQHDVKSTNDGNIDQEMRISCASKGHELQGESEYAAKFRASLNPMMSCPTGPLAVVDADIVVKQNIPLSLVGPNNENTSWKAYEDRPSKFGFIIDNYVRSREKDKNTMRFDLKISSDHPSIKLEYMHSYEGVGKISIKLLQSTVTAEIPARWTSANGRVISPGTYLVLDTYAPTAANAVNAIYSFRPSGFTAGEITLDLTLIELTPSELKERGGTKVKIVSVKSC